MTTERPATRDEMLAAIKVSRRYVLGRVPAGSAEYEAHPEIVLATMLRDQLDANTALQEENDRLKAEYIRYALVNNPTIARENERLRARLEEVEKASGKLRVKRVRPELVIEEGGTP